ncbi:MAG: head-tail adaptor protein [bacterium]|nr:head-tail adaptor protein [bacterium]
MPDASLIARLRAAARRYLTERCTIQRETVTTGAYGDSIRAWATVTVDVPCRLVRARRSDLDATAILAGRETLRVEYRLAIPHDADLRGGDRVIVGEAVYRVVRIEAALTEPIYRQAIIARR